jgi:hypothetical protein
MTDLLMATRRLQRTLGDELIDAVTREQRLIRSALENHTSMPDNYWHQRHKLEQQVKAINAIVEVLEEY